MALFRAMGALMDVVERIVRLQRPEARFDKTDEFLRIAVNRAGPEIALGVAIRQAERALPTFRRFAPAWASDKMARLRSERPCEYPLSRPDTWAPGMSIFFEALGELEHAVRQAGGKEPTIEYLVRGLGLLSIAEGVAYWGATHDRPWREALTDPPAGLTPRSALDKLLQEAVHDADVLAMQAATLRSIAWMFDTAELTWELPFPAMEDRPGTNEDFVWPEEERTGAPFRGRVSGDGES